MRHGSLLFCAILLAGAMPLAAALEVGDRPPALRAPKQDGLALSLESFAGDVIYVDFWASWCAPCAQALPALDGLYRKHGESGFTVFAVNLDAERAPALAMLARFPVGYPVVFDPEGRWPAAFGLRGMPSGYLLDRSGRIVRIHSGYKASDLPELEAEIVLELGKRQ